MRGAFSVEREDAVAVRILLTVNKFPITRVLLSRLPARKAMQS